MESRLESRIDELRQLAAQGLPWKAIGAALGVHKESARRFAERHGIRKALCLSGRRPLQERLGNLSVLRSQAPISEEERDLRSREKNRAGEECFARRLGDREFESYAVAALPRLRDRVDVAEGMYVSSLA